MKSLKTKMIIFILPIFILIFSFVITYSYFNSRKIIVSTRYAELNNFVASEKYKITGWFDKNLKTLDATKKSLENTTTSVDAELKYMGRIIKDSNGDISDIYYGTTEGLMVDGSGWVPPADYDPRKRPWYPDGLKSDKIIYGKPYLDLVTGKMAVSAAGKFLNPDGSLRGVFSGDLILETVSNNIAKVKFGETVYAYIIDKDTGTVVAHSTQKDYIGKKMSEIDPNLEPVQKVLMEKDEGIYDYSMNGDKKYVAYNSIPELRWNLGVVIPEEEVLAELNSFRNKMLIVVVISIILLSLIIERISTSIIKPIKLLVGKVLEISDGDLNVQIDVKGKDELAVLSKEFNGFVTRLRESMGKIKNLVSDSKISNDNIKKSIDK